jgi:hypothetical protein
MNVIKLILDWFLSFFKKLPYPEESRLKEPMTSFADIQKLRYRWLKERAVPLKDWEYWENITIRLAPDAPFAWCSGEEIAINPYWGNVGVLAHEAAHRSWSFLTEQEKRDFAVEHDRLKVSDPYLRLLYSKNQYGLSSDIEGHAEVMRYLCNTMPESLKKFYPRLLES